MDGSDVPVFGGERGCDARGMTDLVTLALDPESQGRFEAMRQRYFPAERNVIPAHLTLFHTVPRERWVGEALRDAVGGQRAFQMRVTGVRSLGKGVAYTLASAELGRLHQELVGRFGEVLTAQDRQGFRAHVVVQNKVTPEVARGLLRELEGTFTPWEVGAVGVDLWHYLGGPWELAERFGFVEG